MSEHATPPSPTVPPRWRDDLVLALRARDVSGRRIGEVLAEVEEFCAESGQDAPSAFGPAPEYASQVTDVEPATARSGLRSGTATVPGLLGMLLVLASAGAAHVPVTLGMAVAVAVWVLTAVVVVQVVVRPTEHRARTLVAIGLLVWVGCAVGTAAMVVLDQRVVTLPSAVALGVGAALVVVPAVVETVRGLRSPSADLVVSPWDDPATVRRRNAKVDVGIAWAMPIGTALAYGVISILVAATR